MGPDDDLEAFLTTVKLIVSTTGWALIQWATLLAPYLTEATQATYQSLLDEEDHNYWAVKMVILDALFNSDTYCSFAEDYTGRLRPSMADREGDSPHRPRGEASVLPCGLRVWIKHGTRVVGLGRQPNLRASPPSVCSWQREDLPNGPAHPNDRWSDMDNGHECQSPQTCHAQ